MADPSEACDPLGELADEFLERRRRGEEPSVGDYLDRIPDRRDELRDLLSALVAVERLKPESDEADELPAAEESEDEDRPDRLGDYRILREIGRGGMGVVYEAEQLSLGRRVALKVLAPWLRPAPQQVQRFLREARSAAQLHHPDIVPIFGVGEHDGLHYYAMQFIAGHGLDRVLNDVRRLKSPPPGPCAPLDSAPTQRASATRFEGGPGMVGATVLQGAAGLVSPASPTSDLTDVTPLDAPDSQYRRSAAVIIIHAAEALQYAHDQGMLHRDIKPSNLLLDENGKVWVTDFGLVKALDGQDLTCTGDIVGTLRYMAPERFQGRCDVRSDVYSLGLTLYETLALQPAFDAADRNRLIHQITQEDSRPIRRLLPNLPRDLATIVQTAVAHDPEDRYATAGRLAEDLRRWLRHEPIQARPSPAHERAAKWARRNPAVASLAVAAVLAGFAALTILAYGYVQVSRTLYHAQRLSYFQKVALAERAWSGNDVGRAEELLDDAAEEFRSWEWFYLKRLCHSELTSLRTNPGEQPNALAFGPDGATAATAGPRGRISLWEVPSGRHLRTLPGHERGVYALAFRPDGAVLASAGGDMTIRLHDLATGRTLASLPLAHGREALAAAFSPDGTMLASCAGVFWETVAKAEEDGDLTLWDAASGRPIRTLIGHEGSIHQAVFSPDGARLASAGGDGSVRVWDPATGRALLDLRGHDGVVMGVAYSPDGRRIVSAGLDGSLRTWDAETGAALATFHDPGERFLAVAWASDGRWIAAAGRSWAVTVWDAETGRKVETYRGHSREATGVAFGAGGGLLGSAGYDGLVQIWDAGHGQDATTMSGFAGAVTSVAFDPLGRWLAATDEVGPVQLRELAPGRPAPPKLDALSSSHASAAFHPDGRRLAAGGRFGPGLVEVWSATTGRRLHALKAGTGRVAAVAYSPDGRLLAAGDESGVVTVWNATTGAVSASFVSPSAQPVTALAFSPDGRRIAASTGERKRVECPGTTTIWDLDSGRVDLTIRGHAGGVSDLAFSPDGGALATAGWDQSVKVWDLRDGAIRGDFAIRGLLVWAVAFTPDGRRVVAADNVGRITFWDFETGHELLTIPAHADRIYDLAFGGDGRLLASAGRDAVVKLRDATPAAPAPARDRSKSMR